MKKLILTLLILISATFATPKTVAIIDFDAVGVSKQEAQILTKKLSSEFVKHGTFAVLERGQIDTILKEQGFQQTGCVTSECAVEVGQILGVQNMIAGSIGKLGEIYYVEVKLIDVTTSKILKNVDRSVSTGLTSVLTKAIPEIVAELSGGIVISQSVVTVLETPKESNEELFYKRRVQPRDVRVEAVAFDSDNYIFLAGVLQQKSEKDLYLVDGTYEISERNKAGDTIFNSDTISVVPRTSEAIEVHLGGDRKKFYIGLSCAIATPGSRVSSNELNRDDSITNIFAPVVQVAMIEEHKLYQGVSVGFNTIHPFVGSSSNRIDVLDSAITFEHNRKNSYFVAFYTLLREIRVSENIKFGVGAAGGIRFLLTEWSEDLEGGNDGYENYNMVSHYSYKRVEFGGPKAHFAMGAGKIFFQFSFQYNLGYATSQIQTYKSQVYYDGDTDEKRQQWQEESSSFSTEKKFSATPELNLMLYIVL